MRFAQPSLLQVTKESVARAIAMVATQAARAVPPSPYKNREKEGGNTASPPFPLFVAIDATCGNGHDTLFLADTMQATFAKQPWQVLGFDIQPAALQATQRRMSARYSALHFALHGGGHQNVQEHLPPGTQLCAAMFNLGYLPGSDKTVTTQTENTLFSLEAMARRIIPMGILSIHTYGGHPGGKEEMDAIAEWCKHLPSPQWRVMQYTCCNKNHNPEALYLAQKTESLYPRRA